MLLRCTCRRLSHNPFTSTGTKRESRGRLLRRVDGRGFAAQLVTPRPHESLTGDALVHFSSVISSKDSALFCGSHGTGKLTLLRAVGAYLEEQGKEVAYASFDPSRAHRLDGVNAYTLLGLRLNTDELPIQEQMEGTFERHVRLVDSAYEHAIHSIATCDVLVLDSLHLAQPVIVQSLDAVCRRLRCPKEPFGGLRILASACFWSLPVHPGCDTGGYLFQLRNWDELFPLQVHLNHIYGQSRELGVLTDAALMGTLTPKQIMKLQERHVARRIAGGNFGKKSVLSSSSSADNAATAALVDMTSNSSGIFEFRSRFPKQPYVLHSPPKASSFRRIEIGHFLLGLVFQSALPDRFSLLPRLSLEVGSKTHLIYPLLHRSTGVASSSSPSDDAQVDVPAGEPGEVVQLHPHRITVLFPRLRRTVDIPRMRVDICHSAYPEITYSLEQFPLYPRRVIIPQEIIAKGGIYGVHIDCRRLADTNDLGNVLSRMRSLEDFTMSHVKDYLRLEGVVHEPTRIYYSKLRNIPVSTSAELWCKNCKGHVPTSSFHDHWNQCIHSVRWCPECDETVPLAKLEAHMEKHQVVMCIDCGQAIEWKYWETHRLSCMPMMRELSSDNEFLPETTRRIAVELGLDKRDLHTVRQINRSMLPKSKVEVYRRQVV